MEWHKEKTARFTRPALLALLLWVILSANGWFGSGGVWAAPQGPTVYEFEDVVSSLDFSDVSNSCSSNPVVRTITVPDSFLIGDVDFGFTAVHKYRQEIRLWLVSPQDTRVDVLQSQGGYVRNLDILLDDGAVAPVDSTTNHDFSAPYFENHAQPSSPLAAFIGEDAQGDWKVFFCDEVPQDNGVYLRSLLRITASRGATEMLDGYWSFEDGGGPVAADSSGNGHDGTILGDAGWIGDDLAPITPQGGSALILDGVDDYVDVTIDISEQAYALSLWFKTTCATCGLFSADFGDRLSAQPLAVADRGSRDHDRDIWLSGGQVCANLLNSNVICTAGTYNDGQWHHLVHTFESEQRIYVDGFQRGQRSVNDTSGLHWQDGINIGYSRALGVNERYFEGLIDDVRIYARGLRPSEVFGLAQGGPGCAARLSNGEIYRRLDGAAVQIAVNNQSAGGELQLAGSCLGVQEGGHLARIAKNISLQGGWSQDFSAQDAGLYPTVLDANSAGRLFTIDSGQVELDSLTLRKGRAHLGAAVYNQGSLTIRNSRLAENWALGEYGEYVSGYGGGGGGGAGVGGAIYTTGSLRVYDSTFDTNRAEGGGPGSSGGSSITAGGRGGGPTGGNGGSAGAGSSNGGSGGSGGPFSGGGGGGSGDGNQDFTFSNAGNGGTGGFGGGGGGGGGIVHITTGQGGQGGFGGGAGLAGSNNAGGSGGGGAGMGGAIFGQGAQAQIVIEGSTLSNNEAIGYGSTSPGGGYGGAIFLYEGSQATVQNSTLFGNEAGNLGGAIFQYESAGQLRIEHSTISRNRAQSGGGLATYGNFSGVQTSVGHSIVAGNEAGTVESLQTDIYYAGGGSPNYQSLGYNLIGFGNRASSFNQTGDRRGINSGSLRLLPESNSGGPTLTLMPQPDSPAVDQGDPNISLVDETTDQRQQPRKAHGRIDIGAVEVQPVCLVKPDAGDILFSEDSQAVQVGLDAAVAGDTVAIAGECVKQSWTPDKTQPIAEIVNPITLQGGWDADFTTFAPQTNESVLDAGGIEGVIANSSRATTIEYLTVAGGAAGNASQGGGIYNDGVMTISHSSVVRNSEAAAIANGGTMTIAFTTVADNHSLYYGGGIDNYGDLYLTGSTVSGNSAGEGGGGIYDVQGTLTILNSTISGNQAPTGGGLYISEASLNVRFSTLARNQADQGASIFVLTEFPSTLLVVATIIAEPQPAGAANCAGTPWESEGYNRISDNSCLSSAANGDQQGVPIQLDPLGFYGGSTQTHRLQATRDLVDIIDRTVCEGFFGTVSPEDQRGRTRPSLGIREEGVFVPDDEWKCDAGAVELGAEAYQVCGPPLLDGYNGTQPNFTDNLRCDYPTIWQALERAITGDTIVVTGLITESVTINKNVTLRGPSAEEGTPGAHMGIVQGTASPAVSNPTAGGTVITVPQGFQVTVEDLNIRHGNGTQGGAIKNAGDLTLNRVTLYNNQGHDGAAIFNQGQLAVNNSTVFSNTALTTSVISNTTSGTARLNHVTLSANSGVMLGNAATAGSTFAVKASILDGTGGSQCSGPLTSGGYNLISAGACFAQAAPGDKTGAPQLGPLRDNGGATLTQAIPANSPAANSAVCSVATDQRGRNRPGGASCDSGAFEYAPAVLTVCQACDPDPQNRRYTNLQTALNRAMAGDTVRIEAGIYTGNFIVFKDMTLEHAGIDVTAVSQEQPIDVRAILQASPRTVREQRAGSALGGTVLTVQSYAPLSGSPSILPAGDLAVTLKQLTIRQGVSNQGGGIYNRGNLTLVGSTVEGNAAFTRAGDAKGGAIYNTGTVRLERSTIHGNQSEYFGGAIYTQGQQDRVALVELIASTVSDNKAEVFSAQHLLVIDNDIIQSGALKFINPITRTSSGDEILFQNKLPFAVTLNVGESGAKCNRTSITLAPATLATAPLICTVSESSGSFDLVSSQPQNLRTTIQVDPLGFVPVAHTIYADDYSQVTVARSILVNEGGSGANCGGSANPARWTIRSAGYNLVDDTSCNLTESTDLRPGAAFADADLGPLQDNNIIDFQANRISGYAYSRALLPGSPAIDQIPPAQCSSGVSEITVAVSAPNRTVRSGDLVRWTHTMAGTVALYDGENGVVLLELRLNPATNQYVTDPWQFERVGDVGYRVYRNTSRAEIAVGKITVTANLRALDQRGVVLPQQGPSDRYYCDIGAYEFQPWIVGQSIPRPPAAVGNQTPQWEIDGAVVDSSENPYHAWNADALQDIPLRPSAKDKDVDVEPGETVTVVWKVDSDPASDLRMRQTGVVNWPAAPQIHISASPVTLNHTQVNDGYLVSTGRAFEGREPADEAAGQILGSGIFNRTLLPAVEGDSYSILQFVKGSQASATLKLVVVKTVDWNAPGVRDMRDRDPLVANSDCTIGTEIRYWPYNANGLLPGHEDPEGKNGWILTGSAYDGVQTAPEQGVVQNTVGGNIPPLHVRENRTGPIIPILARAPTFVDNDLVNGGHDLRIAWYRPDARNVAWPVKAVGYRCNWPQNPPQIVIASELGSEMGVQAQLDPVIYGDPAVYHQPDASQPGFSPNYEHSLLATSNLGNPFPAFYALRTDLWDRNANDAGFQSYALLKYRDAREENLGKIAVYRVLLTKEAQPIANIVPVNGSVKLLPVAVRSASSRSAAAVEAVDLTLRVGSGDLAPGSTVVIPVEALSAQSLRTVSTTLTYDPAQIQPTRCTPNRLDFVEAPADLELRTNSPVKPGRVIRMQALLAAGTDVQYEWRMGDGTVRIAGSEVSHVYGVADSYTVTVTVLSGEFEGVFATSQVTVSATALPGAFTSGQRIGCRSDQRQFGVTEGLQAHVNALQTGSIGTLRPRFTANGFTLGANLNISTVVAGKVWRVEDTANSRTFTVIREVDLVKGDESTEALGVYLLGPDNRVALTLQLTSRNKHGLSGNLVLADLTFRPVGAPPTAVATTDLVLGSTSLTGPDYEALRYNITAGNPVFAPTPMRSLLDIQICEQTNAYQPEQAIPFWKDFKGALWARAAGSMQVLYYYPLQPGFYLNQSQAADLGLGGLSPDQQVGQCVPWLHAENNTLQGSAQRVYPVTYSVSWPALPALLTVGETVFEKAKGGISGVATQLAVSRIYDDQAPGAWSNDQAKIVMDGPGVVHSLAELIDPVGEVRVPLDITVDDNPSLPQNIESQRLLFGGGQSVVGTVDREVTLPFSLRSRIRFDDGSGELVFAGYYDGASPQYIKGDPLLLLNVMSLSDKTRLRSLCEDEDGNLLPDGEPGQSQCRTYLDAVEALYHLSRNPRQLDLCRTAAGRLFAADPRPATNQGPIDQGSSSACTPLAGNVTTYRDGQPDQALLLGVQDENDDGIPEPYEGLGKGKALTAGNASGTGYVTLAYNNDNSLGGLPVSLQVVQVGCTLNAQGEDSTYRGNLLVIESDNLFDEKLTLRHTGDFGGQPDNFEFEWYIAEVDDTGISPTAVPGSGSFPWTAWNGSGKGTPEITIEGANPTTLSDNWLVMRYKGYPVCGNQYLYSAFAGDPSAKPSELRAQLAPGWIKRVTSALNPFDARVTDFVSSPVNTTVDMVRQAGPRYEGPIAMSNDPETLNSVGLIEAYETVLRRGRSLSIDSNINHQGANAALLNVTSRIAGLYMLLGNDAYADALDPTVGLGTGSALAHRAPTLFAFMNQFRPDSFGPLDEELALLRGRDETLGGVAAGPTYNRLTWNFTNGDGEVAYVTNYNIQDFNQDGFVNEADGMMAYPQGHGDAWGHELTAVQKYYELLRHPNYTWSPRAEPIGVAGAPVVVDYYDEQRFAAAVASKAGLGAEIVNLSYRKHYAEPESQPYIDEQLDASDGQRRAWGVADWARRAGQGAYLDWIVANAMVPPVDERYSDVRKIDRTTVTDLADIAAQFSTIQAEIDKVDTGLNPLGIADDAVLFDLDPAQAADGVTHFEQVYKRALTSMSNALALFDYANEVKLAQRESQNEHRDFMTEIIDQDSEVMGALIELFGYPYDADIGDNGTYPDGYEGPDIYNYDLYDRTELTDAQKRCSQAEVDGGSCAAETKTYLLEYNSLPCIGFFPKPIQSTLGASGICRTLNEDSSPTFSLEHRVGVGLDADRGRFKPSAWPEDSARQAPGEIQTALRSLNQARLEYEMAIQAYENHLESLVGMQAAIKDQARVMRYAESVNEGFFATTQTIDGLILAAKEIALVSRGAKEVAKELAEKGASCPPESVGFSNDLTSAIRCGINLSGLVVSAALSASEKAAQIASDVYEFGKGVTEGGIELDLAERENDFELRQMGREMAGLLREERELRLALFLAKDVVQGTQGDYDLALDQGFRTLGDLIQLRQRWAGQISEERYNDMAYRSAEIAALQNYRKQFDLAQTYVYLTAAAYDYETNLTAGDPARGKFLRQIVATRSLGELRDARPLVEPIVGSGGLAESLGQMRDNFAVLKGQLGFNNPQVEANTFSLRSELFRLRDDSDAKWRQELLRYYTPNIYNDDAVARLAKRPFGETGAEPGLVIPFGSTIYRRLNFFGQPLGPGDGAYSASQFVTKIAGAGVWFEDYDTTRLANTPRVYLIPAGKDVVRPRGSQGLIRYWNISEQLLPVPYPIGRTEMENSSWLPTINGLTAPIYQIKPYADMRAYPFEGAFDPSSVSRDTRLIGRSVWNTRWLLVIPGSTLLADPQSGIERFVESVDDIHIYFETYAYAGTRAREAEVADETLESLVTELPATPRVMVRAATETGVLPLPDLLLYGSVTQDGQPAQSGQLLATLPRGDALSALIGPMAGAPSNYLLVVSLNQVASGSTGPALGSAQSGESLTFFVDQRPAHFQNQSGLAESVFTIPAQAGGSAQALNLSVDGPVSYPIGDVNASGRRDSADALMILKYDVGLTVGVNTFPPGPRTLYLPLCDMVSDGRCNASDALRVMQCDVAMPGVSCSDAAQSVRQPAAALLPVAPTPLGLDVQASADGTTLTVQVRLGLGMDAGSPSVAAASVTLAYDPSVMTPEVCAEIPDAQLAGAACNLAFAPDAVRFNGISVTGMQSGAALGQVTFRRLAPSSEAVAQAADPGVTLTSADLFDLGGQEVTWQVEGSSGAETQWRSIYLPLLRYGMGLPGPADEAGGDSELSSDPVVPDSEPLSDPIVADSEPPSDPVAADSESTLAPVRWTVYLPQVWQ